MGSTAILVLVFWFSTLNVVEVEEGTRLNKSLRRGRLNAQSQLDPLEAQATPTHRSNRQIPIDALVRMVSAVNKL